MNERIQAIWKASIPIDSERAAIGRTYISNRGLSTKSLPSNIHFHPELITKRDQSMIKTPGLVLPLSPNEGEIQAIHRIFLSSDGRNVICKKLMGPQTNSLLLFGSNAEHVAVAEGPETSLAIHQSTGLPTYCSISASSMPKIVLPNTVKKVDIFSDKDRSQAGQEAAVRLYRKLIETNVEARLFLPREIIPKEGKSIDWLDIHNERGQDYIKNAVPTPVPELLLLQPTTKPNPINTALAFLYSKNFFDYRGQLNLYTEVDRIFHFEDGLYTPISDKELKNQISAWLPTYLSAKNRKRATTAFVTNVTAHIKAISSQRANFTKKLPTGLLNLANGHLNLNERRIYEDSNV